jgi:two-component system, NarL family, response regulator DevR
MDRIRVFIVDDHPIVRLGLRDLLSTDPGIVVVGEAGSTTEALHLLQSTPVDVLIADLVMPDIDGTELVRRLHYLPNPPLPLAVSGNVSDDLIRQAFQAGVRGYFLKTVSGAELAEGIRRVARGEYVLSEQLLTPVLTNLAHLARIYSLGSSGLTDAELVILRHLASGATNREIAHLEYMSEPTVKRKAHTIYHKLGTSDRAGAVSAALRLGLI